MKVDKNLVQRSLSGLVFLAVMIFCICFSKPSAVILLITLSVLASWELVQLVGLKTGSSKYRYVTVGLLAVTAVLTGYVLLNPEPLLLRLLYFLPLAALSLLFLLPDTMERRMVQPAVFIFALFYTIVPFALMQSMVRYSYSGFQYFDLLFLFILVWTNDTMAYVCGRLVGKHKLAPEISPKKTIEGFIGGIVFSIVAAGIVFYIRGNFVPAQYLTVVFMGVMVGTAATIGDLFESGIKRWAGVKDSGTLIPGHGGILDRFDGVMFAVWPYFFLVSLA